jgi:hypothetical protein
MRPGMQRQRLAVPRHASGYILFEALIALTVLSVSIYVIQEGLRQAVIARGHARDYTQARFLLEGLVNQLQVQPIFKEESQSGTFAEDERFAWSYSITAIVITPPPPPPEPTELQLNTEVQLPVWYLGKIEATIRWSRSGMEFEESVQTLFAPERLWLPPPPPEGGQPGAGAW